MDIIKVIGIGFTALIVIILLRQYKPEFAVYVSLIAGIIILFLVFSKLDGIIDLLKNLANTTGVNSQFLAILIKITGIAVLTEFAVGICNDSGESVIASKVDLGGKVIIISLSIPIISSLLETVLKIMP